MFALFIAVLALAAGIGPAAASAFDPALVVQALKRELAALEASVEPGSPGLRVEEAVLDLDLVEVTGKGGGHLLVPAADFGTGKDEPAKPALRRRMLVDLARAGDGKAAEARPGAADTPATAAPATAGALARVLTDLRGAFRTTVDSPPTWEFKRLGVDLEFAIDRDGKGLPILTFFAAGRPIDARNVQKLKLRLAARER